MKEKLKRVYKSIMLIIVVALITFILTTLYMSKNTGKSKYVTFSGINAKLMSKISAVKSILDRKYISKINEEDLINGAVQGYVAGLGDEYTQYFTKEEMEDFMAETEGNYVGIGIYMYKDTVNNNVVILYPIKGSPAETVGLSTGDIIRKVDGIEYTGVDFEKISTYIKGKEGTKVNLEIEREGKILTFEVERRSIELYPIESEILENNVGYIRISSFDENCAEEFKEKYNKLNNIKGLIIDLRNNGGGIVAEALEIADYVLEKDKVMLITKDKNGTEEVEKSIQKPIINIPIVILTNENTASASEILAAALKDNNKAIIVGEKTYGKGVIQELITLSDGSGIKVTTEEYYTPNRNKINEVGITPDKEVCLPEDVISSSLVERKDDTQLKEAINVLSSK